jgi:hypothetical protein
MEVAWIYTTNDNYVPLVVGPAWDQPHFVLFFCSSSVPRIHRALAPQHSNNILKHKKQLFS